MKSVVFVVVVTWNRLEMLKRCVASVKRHLPDATLVVVDNASTDGTSDWLKVQGDVDLLLLPQNTGGAGGFAVGMQRAYDRGADWIWIMDDDVEVLPEAAEILAKSMALGDLVQLARKEADGTECVFEGRLDPRTMRRSKLPIAALPSCGYASCNIASFEGLFVSRRVIQDVGVPDASFFYGLDDLFYGYVASTQARFVYLGEYALLRQIDKRRASLGGKKFYSSSPTSRYYHLRNFWKVMRYLRKTGKGSARMYFTYAYEAAKALGITLLVELDFRGAARVLGGIRDGYRGRGGLRG